MRFEFVICYLTQEEKEVAWHVNSTLCLLPTQSAWFVLAKGVESGIQGEGEKKKGKMLEHQVFLECKLHVTNTYTYKHLPHWLHGCIPRDTGTCG